LVDRHYIFPEGEENIEKEWYDSNIHKLADVLDGIPVMLGAANFSYGQKMMMLQHDNPNSIHLAIKDAVDQKAEGLYDFMIHQIYLVKASQIEQKETRHA